jgi:hypothetical protein
VSNYLQCIPVPSTTLPSGIRFVESNALSNVLVLLRDTTFDHGPWTFLPRTASQKAAAALTYWDRQRGYRLSDEDIYSVVDRNEVIEFCYPRGAVLFIESSPRAASTMAAVTR